MADVTITCPECGFSKDVPREKLPGPRVRINCPRCRVPFVFDAGTAGPATPVSRAAGPAQAPEEPAQAPQPQPAPTPAAPPDTVTISCPSCGFAKDVPRERLPAGSVTVNCPKCRESFILERPGPAGPAPPTAPAPSTVAGLLSSAWASFTKRPLALFALLLLLYLAPVAAAAVFVGGGYLLTTLLPSGQAAVFGLCGALGVAAGLAVYGTTFGALIHAVADENLGVGGALGAGRLRMWSFIWAGLLVGFMVAGGTLFLVMPGIVFSVWFSFTFFVLAEEGDTGMVALLKSREYVSGRFLDVFLRILVVWAVSLVGFVPLVGPVLLFLVAPLVLVYLHRIYRYLRETRPVRGFAPGAGEKAKWLATAGLGFVFIPLLLAAFAASFTMKHDVSLDQMLKSFGLDRTFELSLPSIKAGSGADRELVEVFTEYRKALDNGDMKTLKRLVAPDVADELDGPGGGMMLEMIRAFSPGDVRATASEADGDTATLHVESAQEGGVMKGRISMVRHNGAWKVARENWDMTIAPAPVELSGGSSATGFGPLEASLLAPAVFGPAGEPAHFFDEAAKPRLLATLTGHDDAVSGLAFTPDGSRLVSASYSDFTVRLWDTGAKAQLDAMKLEYRPVSIALTPDGLLLVVADAYGNVSFIPVGPDRFGDGQRAAADIGHEPRIAVSPNGRLLATSSYDRTVTIWDIEKRLELRRIQTDEPMRAIAFSPSGSMLAAGSTTHRLTLWDLASGTGRTYAVSKVGKDSDISAIGISPDSRYLVTGHMDSSIVVWDLNAQEELFNFYVTDASTTDAAFSPAGEVFATAHANDEIYLWEPSTARRLMTLRGQKGYPIAIAFSQDGRYMASCGADRKILIWGRTLERARPASAADGGVQVSVTMTGVDGRDGDASVWLDKSSYQPGERVTVHFTAPDGYAPDAWIGIIPSSVRHGSESENDSNDIAYQYLSGRTSGDIELTAPGTAGGYDIRMHDTDAGGSEVAFTTFTVSGDKTAGRTGDYVRHEADVDPGDVMVYVYALNYRGMVR